MALEHDQVVTATRHACDLESSIDYSIVDPGMRYNWLTEAELTARLRSALIGNASVQPEWTRLNAQGRKAKGIDVTNFDLEFGRPCYAAIEVVYCWGRAAPSPAAPLNDDLSWLVATGFGHVVAFFPRMRPGYRVQKNPTPFEPDGTRIALAPGEWLLCDSLQIGGLSAEAHQLCEGLVTKVTRPKRGTTERWSIVDAPVPCMRVRVGRVTLLRTVVGLRTARLWAVVWSHT